MEIKIKKVKLVDGGEKMKLGFHEDATIDSDNDKTCNDPVHEDLSNAMNKLAVHLAILTDYIEAKNSHKHETIDKFTVTGYSIGGAEGEEGFTITGHRSTKRGGTVILNTPFTRFEEAEEARYILIGDVQDKIASIETEVIAYLKDGKKKPKEQLELDLPEEKVTHAKIATPEGIVGEIVNEANTGMTTIGNKLPPADADAMARVAEMGNDKPGKKGRKKVAQTAVHPPGRWNRECAVNE